MSKILCYIDMLHGGGAQRVMSVLANSLCKSGNEVILVNDFVCENEKEYTLNNRITRLFLESDNKGNLIIKNLVRIARLRRILKSQKPDIALSFLGRPNMRFLIAASHLRIKKIVSVRNSPEIEYKRLEYLAKKLFKKADGIVFQTQQAKSWFPKAVQEKSRVIMNPVDESFFETNWDPVHDKYIVILGRLELQKNHELLIKSFSEFHKVHKDIKLLIYGNDYILNGKSRAELLIEMVKALKLQDYIKYMGRTETVTEVLSHASAFVLSSDYEGLPNALMEAMAVGLPCISTDCPCGGPASLIRNNENGILVPVGDEKKLADAMIKVFSEPEFTQTIAKNAKKTADAFKTEKVMEQWEEYLLK